MKWPSVDTLMPLLIVSTILYCTAFMLKVVMLAPLPSDVPSWVVYGGLVVYGFKIINKGLWWDLLAAGAKA